VEVVEEVDRDKQVPQENVEMKLESQDVKSIKSSNSDHSSKKNENDFVRKKQKKFEKKAEADRRSFNMEATIIEENINEEDEYEEEQKNKDKIEESINILLQESIEQSRRKYVLLFRGRNEKKE
jgi:hypothetical protein